MSILDDIRSLDPNDPGRWPLPVRVGSVVACFVFIAAFLFYFLVWTDQKPILDRVVAEEQTLRETFKTKHSKAVNLEVYQQQLADIERSFGALLRQLPGKTEVPNLLVDISQVGVGAGLEEKLFQPSAEVKKDFYAELPIKIKLTGSYHQMGEFVSGIAALPRIVTLHEITIKPENKDMYDNLSFELTAKTFRYLDDAEVAAAEKAKAPAKPGNVTNSENTGNGYVFETEKQLASHRYVVRPRGRAVRLLQQGRRAGPVHRRYQERAGRSRRAAARTQAIRELRVRIGEHAFAVHAGRFGRRQLGCAATR